MRLQAVCEKLFTKDLLKEFLASDAEWFEKATDGAPSSCRPPSATVTPRAKPFGFHEVDTTPTPCRAVQPFKKAELQASKRLQAAMANPENSDMQVAKKLKTTECAPEPKVDELRVDAGQAPDVCAEPKPKKPRKAGNGPMQVHYASFISNKKAEGMSHLEAMRAWATSEERHAVLSLLPETERRRRRYKP